MAKVPVNKRFFKRAFVMFKAVTEGGVRNTSPGGSRETAVKRNQSFVEYKGKGERRIREMQQID